ncbi:hypothetical protein PPERSA_04083 [Pseudocohnilembus persalinus]|uniref:Uncharacterized protein n=1 Tax=Pseudocohnilembus persalinus TaxID=266149 RepID=A0A0V0QLL0_PSEPJ|nr:hypothetical protein PPERSA_04083 [Pseudocohnilembus persalinus]|eukprot:KRX02880.1 hypothetical protein PPERSA_04083 [Pseudocohnilembus persalinus]
MIKKQEKLILSFKLPFNQFFQVYISDEEFELTLVGISNDRFFNHTNLINRSNNYYSSCYRTIDDMNSISETVYKTEEYLQNFQYDINIIQYQVMLTNENNKLIKLPIDSSQQNPETVLTYFVSDSEDVEIEIEEGTFETVKDDQINLSSLHLNFQSVYFNDIKISQKILFN